jgi:hypothetical protein
MSNEAMATERFANDTTKKSADRQVPPKRCGWLVYIWSDSPKLISKKGN